MKKISFILALILFLVGFTPAQAAQTKCKDGTYSSSTGRGTCSSHGGVSPSATSSSYQKKLAKCGYTVRYETDPVQLAAAYNLLKRQGACKSTGGK